MQLSSIPVKFTVPWGNGAGGAYINTPVPTPSQITTNPGFASFTDGFVPLNDTPVASGGIPPRIQDFNGILNQLSAWLRWFQAGGVAIYDTAFQSAVGGYPNESVVWSAVTAGSLFRSIVDNNTTNPDTGGAGWAQIYLPVYRPAPLMSTPVYFFTPGAFSFTVPANIFAVHIRARGGGGGGAGASSGQASSGGGAGGESIQTSSVSPGDTITGSIGGPGAAGASGGAGGGNGGNTTVTVGSVNLLAAGGSGGAWTSSFSAGGNGGTASGGNLSLPGSYGGDATQASDALGGNGAAGWNGCGAGRAGSAPGGGGENATASGAGGGGCYAGAGPGGVGAGGLVEITF